MDKVLIVLDVQKFKGIPRVILNYGTNTGVTQLIRHLPGARYSSDVRAWHLPVSKPILVLLQRQTAAVATLDATLLKKFLLARQQHCSVQSRNLACLSQANLLEYHRLIEHLVLKSYASSTIKTYKNEFFQLLKLLGRHLVTALNADDIRRYMLFCVSNNNLSEGTLNSRINAIKCYFEQVLRRDRMFIELPRPKIPLTLPKVLGEQELARLFNALGNLKHKAILFTAYSAGLRVSEVVQLQFKHIDSDRMQILIECGKGKKDRYVGLSPIVLDILRLYIKTCRIKPIRYIFEGSTPGVPYSSRSAQEIFRMAKNAAGILKDVTFHSLRHSFATHLLEKGVSVVFIKDILGHFNIKTTERYLHVRKEELVRIVSPLDDLWKKGGIRL